MTHGHSFNPSSIPVKKREKREKVLKILKHVLAELRLRLAKTRYIFQVSGELKKAKYAFIVEEGTKKSEVKIWAVEV